MPDVVLRNSDPTVLPCIYSTGPDGIVSDDMKAAGWRICADEDPNTVAIEIADAQEKAREEAAAKPVEFRFASDAATEQAAAEPAVNDQAQQAAAADRPMPTPTDTNQPAEPATPEGN